MRQATAAKENIQESAAKGDAQDNSNEREVIFKVSGRMDAEHMAN